MSEPTTLRMSDLTEALKAHQELCDLFDLYLLSDNEIASVAARGVLFDRFVNGGEQAMHKLADFFAALTSPETIEKAGYVVLRDWLPQGASRRDGENIAEAVLRAVTEDSK